MDIERLIVIAMVYLLSGVLQSTVGFGFSLLASPLLLFFHIPLAEAVALCIIGSTVQRALAVFKLRHHLELRTLAPMGLFIVIGLPLGILILRRLTFLPPDRIKQVIGLLILLVLIMQWGIKVKPREVVPRLWGLLAAFCSGILNGMANIGGPPLILWILAHNWSNQKMRVMPIALTLSMVPIQLFLMWKILDSAVMAAAFKQGLLACPAALFGSALGLFLGNRLSIQTIRVAVQCVLIVIALTAIFQPFFG